MGLAGWSFSPVSAASTTAYTLYKLGSSGVRCPYMLYMLSDGGRRCETWARKRKKLRHSVFPALSSVRLCSAPCLYKSTFPSHTLLSPPFPPLPQPKSSESYLTLVYFYGSTTCSTTLPIPNSFIRFASSLLPQLQLLGFVWSKLSLDHKRQLKKHSQTAVLRARHYVFNSQSDSCHDVHRLRRYRTTVDLRVTSIPTVAQC